MNHNEHPITVIIGIGLLIALGLVLHLRHNQKIKQENREALAENQSALRFFRNWEMKVTSRLLEH